MNESMTIERAQALAATLSTTDLPQPLRQPAEEFLRAQAAALRGHWAVRSQPTKLSAAAADYVVRQEIELHLLLIACFGSVPQPAPWRTLQPQADDERLGEAKRATMRDWGLDRNAERRRLLGDLHGPLLQPLFLWFLLRDYEREVDGEADPDRLSAPYTTADRLAFIGSGSANPLEALAPLADVKGTLWQDYYRQWRARRAQQTEVPA